MLDTPLFLTLYRHKTDTMTVLNDSKTAMGKERLGEIDERRCACKWKTVGPHLNCDHLVREEGKLALLHVRLYRIVRYN